MKQSLFGILLAALLVLSIPATVVAASEQSNAHKISGEMSVRSVGRQLNYDYSQAQNGIVIVTGTVTYKGTVDKANGGAWSSLKGSTLVAIEQVDYQIDFLANILPGKGKVRGSLTINGKAGGSVIIKYKADVWGNVAVGPAGDTGNWEVTKTVGRLYESIEESQGSWIAEVALADPSTGDFAGTVKFAGTYKDED